MFRYRIGLPLLPISCAVVIVIFSICCEGKTLFRHTARGRSGFVVERHLWKQPNETVQKPTALAVASNFSTLNIYFLRHGESKFNRLSAGLGGNSTFGDYDSQLTTLGVTQAIMVRNTTLAKLGILDLQPSSIQLVSSGLSRTFDTLVLASEPLWKKWVQQGVDFRLQTLPAAMEVETELACDQRHPGVDDDAPVRLVDSSLASDELAKAMSSGAQDLFYQSEKDLNSPFTTKPVEVLASYRRNDYATLDCTSDDAQLDNLYRYLASTAFSGHSHVLLSTHGRLGVCFFRRFLKNPMVPSSAWLNGTTTPSSIANVHASGLGNADILHVEMGRKPGDHGLEMKGVMLHRNPVPSPDSSE